MITVAWAIITVFGVIAIFIVMGGDKKK